MCVFSVFHKIPDTTCYYSLPPLSSPHPYTHAWILLSFKMIFLLNYLCNIWSDHTIVFVLIKSLQQDIAWLCFDEKKYMFQSINTGCFICDSDMFQRVFSSYFINFLNISVADFFCFTLLIGQLEYLTERFFFVMLHTRVVWLTCKHQASDIRWNIGRPTQSHLLISAPDCQSRKVKQMCITVSKCTRTMIYKYTVWYSTKLDWSSHKIL